jgi:hypothetical protein
MERSVLYDGYHGPQPHNLEYSTPSLMVRGIHFNHPVRGSDLSGVVHVRHTQFPLLKDHNSQSCSCFRTITLLKVEYLELSVQSESLC